MSPPAQKTQRELRDQPLTQIFAATLGGSDFHADQELRRGDWHLAAGKALRGQQIFCFAVVRVRDGHPLLRQGFERDGVYPFGVNVALDAQRHIRRRVERAVAVVQGLVRDAGNTLHRPATRSRIG